MKITPPPPTARFVPLDNGLFRRIDIATGKPWDAGRSAPRPGPQMAMDSAPRRTAKDGPSWQTPEQSGTSNYSNMFNEATKGAGWSDDQSEPRLNARAEPAKTRALGPGGIPERAHAFLKTRLVPDDYRAFLEVLKRAANERPLSGSSLPAMDKRMARPGEYRISMTTGLYVDASGRMTSRRPLALDTSRAEAELQSIIATGRR